MPSKNPDEEKTAQNPADQPEQSPEEASPSETQAPADNAPISEPDQVQDPAAVEDPADKSADQPAEIPQELSSMGPVTNLAHDIEVVHEAHRYNFSKGMHVIADGLRQVVEEIDRVLTEQGK